MHPKTAQALEEIDAAVFSSDTFEDEEAREELLGYLARWKRELDEKTIENPGEDGEAEEEVA